MYTLDDLETAKIDLQNWTKKKENDRGNNPDKYDSDIKLARSRLEIILRDLKKSGNVELTEQEELEKELNLAFPNVKSKEIVNYKGLRFQRIFYPIERSRSRKTVTRWGATWVQL